MQIEAVRQIAGVTEKCMPGAGATAVWWTFRVGSAAPVAPTPGISGIENVSVADAAFICAGYEVDQFSIRC